MDADGFRLENLTLHNTTPKGGSQAETIRVRADRVVFVTGGTFTPRAEDFLRHIKNPRLEKPFDRGALLAALALVL